MAHHIGPPSDQVLETVVDAEDLEAGVGCLDSGCTNGAIYARSRPAGYQYSQPL